MSQEALSQTEYSSESPQNVRENVRQQLSNDIENFLKNGGNVQRVENNVRADPPKKPNMNYGSTPI
jgi:flagellar basal body-associated protein FliL|tara:strand:- start:855 stop:1052 length:198 start_codon:yes stop_codon:yes gene_type:complete